MLERQREEALARVRTIRNDQRADIDPSPGDEMDVARSLSDVETHASLIEIAQRRLANIDDALARVEDGSYGVCESCGEEIPVERLKALPFARRCVDCQREVGNAREGTGTISNAFRKRWTPPAEMSEMAEDHEEEASPLAPEEEATVHDESPFGPEESDLELEPGPSRRRGRPRKKAK